MSSDIDEAFSPTGSDGSDCDSSTGTPQSKETKKRKKHKYKQLFSSSIEKPQKKQKYSQRYCKKWEKEPEFFKWIRPSLKGPYWASCSVCCKDLKIVAGKSDLGKHATSKKHTRMLSNQPSFFVSATSIKQEESEIVKSCAVKIASFITEHGLPVSAAEHLPKLIQAICPDSEIAKQFQVTALVNSITAESSCEIGRLPKMSIIKRMRAILVRHFGGIEQMKVASDVPIPKPGDKQVLIRIHFHGVNPVDTYIQEGEFHALPKLPYIPGFDGAGEVESIGSKVTKFKVLIKVHFSGVNPVDTYLRSGQYSKLPNLPFVPGKDAAGVIESTGRHVTKLKPGDRVFSCHTGQMGSLAEYAAVNEENVFMLGDRLKFEQGAAIGIPYFTAYRALFLKAQAKSGERVLIHGASGAVGLAAIQIAKANGLHVTGTAGTKKGLDLIESMGADVVFNHRDTSYLKKLKGGEPFNIILEMLANVNLGEDLGLMASRGRTVVVGSRGPVTVDPRMLMATEASVTGVGLLASTPDEWHQISSAVVEGIEAGWVDPVVAKVYDLEEAGQAHHDIIHSQGAKGKLVVKI